MLESLCVSLLPILHPVSAPTKSTGIRPFPGSQLVGAGAVPAFPSPFPSEEREELLLATWVIPRLGGVCTKVSSECIFAPFGRVWAQKSGQARGFFRIEKNRQRKILEKDPSAVFFRGVGRETTVRSILRARAGMHQVFPAVSLAAGSLEPGDTQGFKMELSFCFETCLGAWPGTSIFPSNFLF